MPWLWVDDAFVWGLLPLVVGGVPHVDYPAGVYNKGLILCLFLHRIFETRMKV